MLDTSTTQILSVLIVVFALLVTAVLQRGRFSLRPIRAYEAIPDFVGLSIESSQPMHLSIGGTGLGGQSTLLAIATAELAHQITVRASIGDASPILTVSDTSALPLGQDTLRRAFTEQGLVNRYRGTNVRWYPAGARSLAFAAAISAMMADDKISSNVMAGSYGAELALIMEASARRNIPIIATSDQLEGQAVAFALSNETLIGEEVFAAQSYLSSDVSQTAESAAIDLLRWVLVLVLIGGTILTLIGE